MHDSKTIIVDIIFIIKVILSSYVDPSPYYDDVKNDSNYIIQYVCVFLLCIASMANTFL